MRNKICNVCGKPVSECNEYEPKAGLTVIRANREENKIMSNRKIVTSKKRYYVNKDKTKAVEAGSPEADTLLVCQGGEIAAEIAEAYGLETEEGLAVSVVTPDIQEAYDEKKSVNQNVTDSEIKRRVMEGIEPKSLAQGSGVSQQASILAEKAVKEAKTQTENKTGQAKPKPVKRQKEVKNKQPEANPETRDTPPNPNENPETGEQNTGDTGETEINES